MKVLISGDRSINPIIALQVVSASIIRLLSDLDLSPSAVTFVSGLDRGVEAALRFVLLGNGLNAEIFEFAGKAKDYGVAVRDLGVTKVVFIHTSPESSHLYQALSGTFNDDEFELLNPTVVGIEV